MDPIRNIIKVRVNNQDYLYQYENAWDKEKQRSYSKHRITVGKLVDGKVQLGRKFLTNNPQYKDIEFKFEDHKLIATSDLPTVNDAGVNAVLSKTFPLNAGASYVLKEMAQQDGLLGARRSFRTTGKIFWPLQCSSLFIRKGTWPITTSLQPTASWEEILWILRESLSCWKALPQISVSNI